MLVAANRSGRPSRKTREQPTAKPTLAGRTARLGSVSAPRLARRAAGSGPPPAIGQRKGASEDIWPVTVSPPSPGWGEEESTGRASIKRLPIGLKPWSWSWGERGREGGRRPQRQPIGARCRPIARPSGRVIGLRAPAAAPEPGAARPGSWRLLPGPEETADRERGLAHSRTETAAVGGAGLGALRRAEG